jgi:hypothetical protein
MRKLNLLASLCFLLFNFSDGLFAQKPVDNRNLEIIPDESYEFYRFDNMRVNKATGIPIALYNVDYEVVQSTPENMAHQYLYDNADLLFLKDDIDDLVHSTTRETPGGYHVRFNQYVGTYRIYNSNIVVNLNRDNVVTFVMNNYKPGVNITNKTISISITQARVMAINHIGIQGKIYFEKSETIVYHEKGKSRLAQKLILVPAEDHFGDWEVLIDATTGEIFRVEDKAIYSDKKDTGSGWVFDPDPLTRARANYGDPGFSDNNDADSDSLTAQLLQVDLLDLTYSGGQYHLSGPYAQIVDIEAPFNGLYSQADSNFHFTRFADGFEAVNVYYHVDKSMRYINESLGFNLMPFQYAGGVKGDPHGLNGDDNSHYIPSTGELAWGEGYVDDAEDEDVILHELGHGIHDWLTNGGGSQVEGLSEGCGDYWAVSYNRSTGFWTPSDPQYNWVFQWDGHNPFWSGRITNYAATYPGGLVGQVHTDGQIWASTLMQIYDDIGRIATDSNFLEALSMTSGSSSQEDAAQAFIQADINLFGGANLGSIQYWFTQRGYNITVPTPQINHTPLSDTEDLVGPYVVTATIVAAGSLTEVKLFHGTNGVFTDTLDMTPVGNNDYTASISGTGVPTNYNYYIFAADSMGLASTAPAGAPANYFQFYAGPDTIAPVIVHTPLRDQAYIRWPATVSANITDNLGIADVTVNYYVNNVGSTGSFQMIDQGDGNYLGTFNIDTSLVSIGDSIFYRITATDNSSSSNITNDPTAGFHQFYIIDAKGIVLIINDDITKTIRVEGKKGSYYRNKVTLGVSSSSMERWLNNLGYVVEHVNVQTSLTLNWDEYSIVINASGGNTDPVGDASYRAKWESYVTNPDHKYIIEGGEVGYDATDIPGYPTFATNVLHSDDWAGDVSGDMPLRPDYINHPLANIPNLLPQILTLNNPQWGDQDSQNNLSGSYVVYGNTDEPDNAGILVYDDTPNPTSAQMAFYAFNFGVLSDTIIAMNLLENTVEFLLTPESPAIGSITGNVDLTNTTNDSSVVVYLSGLKNDTTVTDTNGDYAFTGLYNGVYSVTTGHPGYFPYSTTLDSIEVLDNTVGGNDFVFDPVVAGTVSGTVSLSDSATNINAIVYVIGQNTVIGTTNDMGVFSISGVMPGNIRILAMKDGYVTAEVDTFLTNDGLDIHVSFMLYPGTNDYAFDFENDNGGFVGSGSWEWGVPTSGPGSAYQGINVWATNLASNYSSGEHSELITQELELARFVNPKLSFVHWYDIEENTYTPGNAYDGGNVKISTDGGSNFTLIDPLGGYPYTISTSSNALNGQPVFSSTSVGWELAEFDLTYYTGMNIILKFDFGTDGSVQYAGWYVDSLIVTNEVTTPHALTNLAVLDSNEVVKIGWRDVTKNLLREKLIVKQFTQAELQMIEEKEKNSVNSSINLENNKADGYLIYKSTDGLIFNISGSALAGDTTYTDSLVTIGNTYYYYVTAMASGMESNPSDTVSVTVVPLVDKIDNWGKGIPTTFAIAQNYPNPFNPVTTIRYQLPKASHVKLEVFTITGQKVKTLVDATQQVNYYTVTWDGLNETGSKVASGIYLYRIEAGDPSASSGQRFVKTNKMLLLK